MKWVAGQFQGPGTSGPYKTAQESFKARYRPTFGTTPDFLLHPYAPDLLSPSGMEPAPSPVTESADSARSDYSTQ